MDYSYGIIAAIEVVARGWTTARGISVGDKLEAARKVYPIRDLSRSLVTKETYLSDWDPQIGGQLAVILMSSRCKRVLLVRSRTDSPNPFSFSTTAYEKPYSIEGLLVFLFDEKDTIVVISAHLNYL